MTRRALAVGVALGLCLAARANGQEVQTPDGGSAPPDGGTAAPSAPTNDAPPAAPTPAPPPPVAPPRALAAGESANGASMGPATEPIPPPPSQPSVTPHVYSSTVRGSRPDPSQFGSSGTTIPRQQVEALPGGDSQPITAFVGMQPGVVQDSFQSNLHFRGNDGAVLYVIDGIPMVSPAVGTVGQLLNTIPMRLVDNVLVLSGGFPVDYSYSLGGIVDIRTRRPTSTPTGELQILYGSYDHVDVAGNYSQQIGRFGVLASADFLTTQRGLDTPDAVSVLNDKRIGGNGFLKATYELTDNDRLEILGTYQEDTFHLPIDSTMLPLSAAPPGAIRGNDVYGDSPPPFIPYDAQPTDHERTIFAALSYLHSGESVNSQLSLYAREIYEDFNCDPTRALGASADPGSQCSNFTRDEFHYGLLGKITWHWLRVHSWKAGIQLDEAPSNVNFSLFTRNDVSPTGGIDPMQTLNGGDNINTITGGVFLEDRIEIGKLTLLPGVRLDLQNTSFGSANLNNLFLYGPSARVGASYTFNRYVTLHAYAGYTWEAPTTFDAPVVAPIVNPSLAGQKLNVDLKGATTWSGEVGLTIHPTGRFRVGVDAWGRIMHNWLDHENIGNTALWAAFNWDQGLAAGGDLFGQGEIVRFWHDRIILDGFGNLGVQIATQKNIDSLTFLISPDDLQASRMSTIQDHVQYWTANLGLILHDAARRNNLSMNLNYGSGYHVGIATNELVPQHTIVNLSVSHTFDMPTQPTVAADVFNLFNDIYAIRLGTASFGSSQFGPLRTFDVRLLLHFG